MGAGPQASSTAAPGIGPGTVAAGVTEAEVPVERLDVAAYTFPVDPPESDGTLSWDSMTVLLVEAVAAGRTGIGYAYTDAAAAGVAGGPLARAVTGRDALDVGAAWAAMWAAARNLGTAGVAGAAISAVDVALWDLKARLLGVPLVVALDGSRRRVPVYGSGGFCSLTDGELASQLGGWAEAGIPRVKLKVGRDPAADRHRLEVARAAVGPDVELFVDANGAYRRAEALRWAEVFGEHGVRWFEEPVTSDDLDGLRLVRERAPGGMSVAAGEYGWDLPTFRRMLQAGAVDCLQADVTRCGGCTGFLRVGALCDAWSVDLSAHCAPQVSAHAGAAVWHLRHLEYFADHVRIEHALFDGCLEPAPDGTLVPDRSRPGHGLQVRRPDVERRRTA